ncbi:XkdF-like putative serine protease domain-containing protein [Streptomyces sp. NPDC088794]|uniref:XkdF-like putative serine protease domain-containing protein n=1 Tax=Streptomyces sp. NPDC088794 TaxID=3365902 RepID=UPI00380A6E15
MTVPEQRYVLGVAHQAGPDPKIQRGLDGARDYFSPEELEKAAWTFLPSGAQVGLFHGPDNTVGHATVVESYIWRADPWDLGDGVTVRKGDWLIGAILDDTAWNLVKSGRVTGWSLQGTARRRPAQSASTDPRAQE